MNLRMFSLSDLARVCDAVRHLPWTRNGEGIAYRVVIEELKPRATREQNSAQHAWFAEAARQHCEFDAEGYRAYAKLHFGVPILRNEDDEFRASYDRVIRPLPYELKLEAMRVPLDLPVTRIMTRDQKSRYLDQVWQWLTGLGVDLERRAA